jgi:protein disulfide-isomerase
MNVVNAFGMDGYCPVSVMDENRWVAGDRQWGAQHRGRTYLFRDAAAQQRFLANPERYAPALAGFDPVLVTELGQYLPGKREHGVRYNDRMYLFGSEEALQKFSQTPDAYVARIEQALQSMAAK